MLRFRGFRASLNLSAGKTDYYDDVPTWAINGAYRTNNIEDNENGGPTQTYKSITPSMIKLPSSGDSQCQPNPPRRSKGSKDKIKNISKSTNDLTQDDTTTISEASHSKSTGNVSLNPRGSNSYSNLAYVPDSSLGTDSDSKKSKSKKKVLKNKETKKEKVKDSKSTDTEAKNESKNLDKELKRAAKEAKKVEKELKRQEKLRLEEQKKQDKLESQILAKEEKLQKAKEKADAKKAKNGKSKPQTPTSQTIVAQRPLTNPLAQGTRNTDTLQSSISKTSAPPPYSETKEDASQKVVKNEPKKNAKSKVVVNESDGTGNTSFGKPISSAGSSWDMISQHREQINRTALGGGTKMKMLNDSQYVTGRKSIII